MNAGAQTIAALAIVAVAAGALVWRACARRGGGCADGECGALSPEIRRLRRRHRV